MAQKTAPKAIPWKKLKAEYVRGGISQQKLAEKYGISYNTLKRRAVAEKWTELRDETYRKYTEKVPEKIADEQADFAVQIARLQQQAALTLYAKAMEAAGAIPSGKTKTAREDVRVEKVVVDDQEKDVPLRETSTVDLDSVTRTILALAKLFGTDEASKLARERLALDKKQGESAEALNAGLISIADLINHPKPNRTMEEVEQ